MNNEQFEKGKEIEYRIFLLKKIYQYFNTFFKGEIISVKIETEIMGEKTTQYLLPNSPISLVQQTVGLDEDDKVAIMSAIESQIKKLEKEFEAL